MNIFCAGTKLQNIMFEAVGGTSRDRTDASMTVLVSDILAEFRTEKILVVNNYARQHT
jgi:hypothetical protein